MNAVPKVKCDKCGKLGHAAGTCLVNTSKPTFTKSTGKALTVTDKVKSEQTVTDNNFSVTDNNFSVTDNNFRTAKLPQDLQPEENSLFLNKSSPFKIYPVAASVPIETSIFKHQWIIDSGASFSMTWNKNIFVNDSFRPSSASTAVQIGDGNLLPIAGIGDVKLDLVRAGDPYCIIC